MSLLTLKEKYNELEKSIKKYSSKSDWDHVEHLVGKLKVIVIILNSDICPLHKYAVYKLIEDDWAVVQDFKNNVTKEIKEITINDTRNHLRIKAKDGKSYILKLDSIDWSEVGNHFLNLSLSSDDHSNALVFHRYKTG
jgi:hypothetical protein